jgi:hypothetical protein
MGTYVCADFNRKKLVTVDRKAIGAREQFRLEFPGNGKVALKDSGGKHHQFAVCIACTNIPTNRFTA